MTRPWILVIVATACQLAAAIRADNQPRRPNIVLLLADDLGYGELGCQGNGEIPTPHIDALAEQGVRFTAGYVTAPFCSASRAGLLTGRYQTRFGYEFNPIGSQNADPQVGLPSEAPTLAERLHDAGYATGLIGKWHLGGTAAYHPQRRGFDEFFGFLHEGHSFVPPPYAGLDGVPILGWVFETGELRTRPGDPAPHRIVHHGHHHGMDGALLVLTALLLSRVLPRMRNRVAHGIAGFSLALMLCYGATNLVQDLWFEQVVERGWTSWEIPTATRPSLTSVWAVIVGATLVVLGVSRVRSHHARGRSTSVGLTTP